jgi:tRNA threonylcarbamoyladenosine biosynthesis protein TsaE
MEYLQVKNLDELPDVAEKILNRINKNRIVAFYGKMGAGKTTLIKALCEKKGVTNKITSPTFALVNEYFTSQGEIIYHFDFYRVNKIEEIYDLGYEDYFYSGHYCFIEWPEPAKNLLPKETIKININELSDHTRQIIID